MCSHRPEAQCNEAYVSPRCLLRPCWMVVLSILKLFSRGYRRTIPSDCWHQSGFFDAGLRAELRATSPVSFVRSRKKQAAATRGAPLNERAPGFCLSFFQLNRLDMDSSDTFFDEAELFGRPSA